MPRLVFRGGRIDSPEPDVAEHFPLMYLPAARNPVDELARREARVLVELLKAEQQRVQGHGNLASSSVRPRGSW